jgi:hypothetical protein
MYRVAKLLVFSSFASVCACSDQSQGNPTVSSTEQSFDSVAPVGGDAPTMGHLGQVRYGYDPNRLTRAEIQIELPPDYEDLAWATKLIPVARARLLGQETCRYGQSGREQTCTAEAEDGLAMALLEGQIGDYRQAFLEDDVPADELSADTIVGVAGFSFTAQAEGEGVRYRFFPVEDRTLLLALRYSGGPPAPDAATAEVLETIRFGD